MATLMVLARLARRQQRRRVEDGRQQCGRTGLAGRAPPARSCRADDARDQPRLPQAHMQPVLLDE